jgi:hypothetical protein
MNKILIKLKKFIFAHEWYFIGALAICSVFLGTIGFLEEDIITNRKNIFDAIYLSLQLFVLQSGFFENIEKINLPLQITRFVSPAILAYATIRSIFYLISEDVGLFFLKDHIIICGMSEKSKALLDDILGNGKKVVVIDNNAKAFDLLNLKAKGAIIISESPSDKTALLKAKFHKSRYIFVLNEMDELNVEIAFNIYKSISEIPSHPKEKLITCFVHSYEPLIEEIFKSHQIYRDSKDRLEMRLLNIYSQSSQILTQLNPIQKQNEGNNDAEISIILAGFGSTGKNILINCALIYHFSTDNKLKAFIIDSNFDSEIEAFYDLYPAAKAVIDIYGIPKNIEELQKSDFTVYLSNLTPDSIYICCSHDLNRVKYARKFGKIFDQSSIFVLFLNSSDITVLIDKGEFFKNQKNVNVFNMVQETCKYDKIVNEEIELMGEKIHLCYCADAIAGGATKENNSSIRDWDELSEDLKESNRQQAYNISLRLKAFGYSIVPINSEAPEHFFKFDHILISKLSKITTKAESDILQGNEALVYKLSKAEHIRWMNDKLMKGWRYKNIDKDLGRKERFHPDLRPFEQLPEESKAKNIAATLRIPDILNHAGKKIMKNIE